MNLPCIGIEREHPSGAVANTRQERLRGFAMVPCDVLVDPRLNHSDIRVYAVLAASRKGTAASLGTRLIARYGCMGQTLAVESARRLKACGYVDVTCGKNGGRAEYRLTSQYFAAAENHSIGVGLNESEERPAAGVKSSQPPPVIHCPLCHNRCRGLLKVGWCRSCNWEKKVRKVVHQEIAKTEKTA